MSTLKNLLHLSVSVDGAQLRVATLNSIQYIVCPVISKVGNRVEWPINSEYPVLIPSSVLALATSSRNNRPVVMGHPQDSLGNYVSANDPEILAKYCYGHMFNAEFADDKVKCEIWLDPVRAEQVGPDAVRVIERLQAGETVEVSEGDYVLSDIEEGQWDGKRYGAKWVACWSDHLATLPENQIGACSIEDGCGTGIAVSGSANANKMVYIVSALGQARKPTYTGTESTPWTKPTFADYIKYLFNGDEAPTSISKCSSDLLRRIASHSLLGDPSATNFQDLTFYPVVNPSTGYLNENALRNVIAGKGSSGLSDSALTSAQEMATRLLNSEFSANIKPKDPKPELEASVDKKKESFFKRMFASMAETLRNSMSNNSLRWKLYKAIEKVDPGISYVSDEDVDAKTVTYLVVLRFGDYWESNESEYHWYQRTFILDENENVTVNDDRIEVEFYEGWKPVGEATPKLETTMAASESQTECGCHKPKGDENMSVNRVSVINRLSASGGPFAGNKAALEAMNDAGLDNLDKAYPVKAAEDQNPNLPATPTNPSPPVEPATPPPTPVNTPPATPPATETPVETQQTVSLSREEYAKMLAASNAFEAQQQARKTQLVTSLSTAQTAFTMPDLQAMEMATLEKMAQALKVDQPPTPQASYVALPVNSATNRPALRELPDPLGLSAHSLRPDGKQIEKAN